MRAPPPNPLPQGEGELERLIKDRIRRDGPISVADYMQLALSHPEYGYYMKKDPLGAAGDFTTSPEISQIFGELIGAWLAQQWLTMGKPAVALVECGPGRGTLLADALRATRHVPGFHDAVSVQLVETSPGLKAVQWKTLAGKHPRIEWHETIETLPNKPLLLIANEFFDALPIRQFIDGKERRVGLVDDKLQFIPAEGDIEERSEIGEQVMAAIAKRITTHGGAALIIDYGHNGAKGDTLQAVKAHQYHDVLATPGEADITAHVDFAALKQVAEASGAAAYGTISQGTFLARLGAGQRLAKLSEDASFPQKSAMISGLERLLSGEQMGELFKVLCVAHPKLPKPDGF